MHFIDTLFSIRRSDLGPTGGTATISLNPDHPVYRGHFPGNPVTPGVCSLEIIMQLLAAEYKFLARPTEVESIKFLNFINPLRTPLLEASIKISPNEEGGWRVRGVLGTSDQAAVKVVARYAMAITNKS